MLQTVMGQTVKLPIESILSAFRKQRSGRKSEDEYFRALFEIHDDVLQLGDLKERRLRESTVGRTHK